MSSGTRADLLCRITANNSQNNGLAPAARINRPAFYLDLLLLMPEPALSDGCVWGRGHADNTVMVRSSGDLVFKYIFKFTKSIFNVNSLVFFNFITAGVLTC